MLLAERKAAAKAAPAYMYLFTYETDFLNYLYKAGHSIEISFVFDMVDDVPASGSRPDKHILADSMSEAWLAFARTGNPSHPKIPKWGPYSSNNRETMIFDVPCRIEIDPGREELNAWKNVDVKIV